MWVIVYQPPQAASAALAHAYRWHRDTGTENPSSPESFVNSRMVVPRPPPAVFRHLYLNRHDTAFENPSTPQSFVNRQTIVCVPPRGTLARLYFWRDARDVPDTTVTEQGPPWAAQRLRQPYAVRPWRYFSTDEGQSNDETPLSWQPGRVRQPYAAPHLLYLVGGATDPSNDEQPLSWTVRPVGITRLSRGTLASLYLWAEATDTPAAVVVDEQAPFWQAQRLRQPYVQPYAARPFYFAGDATGEDAPVEAVTTATYIPTFHARRR